ncbi:MAG TPA: hypothetical protein VMW27_24450 [Thermoanaerobaculia bacterium]|nr:hypothetical protein [Thermoanaerobaculia bacterium]
MMRTLCLAALALLFAAPAAAQTITGRVLPPAGARRSRPRRSRSS